VVDELAAFTNGSEIPFLALRANDWVEPVASRAAEELSRRLVVENRPAVLANLPFIARLFAQQRQDHSRFKDALKVVLTADGGAAALASVKGFETSTRRLVYDLLRSTALTSDAAVVRAALTDRDPVVKRRAVRWLERTEDAAGTIATLERVAVIDRIPLVRRDAIAVLAARAPDRTRQLLRGFLLDSSGPVRSLAQFLVGSLQAPIVAADVYVESLDSSSPRTLAAALDGLRETGLAIGESRIVAFRHHPAPLVRKSVLRSLGAMTPDACVIAALDALSDPAPSVRATAAAILRVHVYRVDLSALQECFDGLSDSRARRQLLRVFRQAPKWSAAELLLEAVGDEDFDVRRDAEGLLRSWLNGFNRAQTPPTSDQLDRVSRRFHAQISRLAPDVARDLGFIVRSFVTPS
jgi:HEAT repeat protein